MAEVHVYSAETNQFSRQPVLGDSLGHVHKGSVEPFFVKKTTLHEILLDSVIDTVTADPPLWQSYTFTFSPSYMVGGGIMEATANTRVATSLRGIRNTAPKSIETNKGTDAAAVLRGISRFLKGSVDAHAGDIKMPRKKILSPEIVANRLSDRLCEQADPVMQAYSQIRRNYEGQIDAPSLDRLKRDLVCAAKPQTVENIYKTYIPQLRSAGDALLRFMMQ